MWGSFKRLRIALLFAAGAMLMLSSGAEAHYYKSCEFYVAGMPAIPRPVAQIMAKNGDAAARACFTHEDKLGLYAPVSAVHGGAVCSFEVSPIVYPVKTRNPPSHYMALPRQAGCPPQNDGAYIEADHVPEGVFAALIAFTDQLCLKHENGFGPFVSSSVHDAAALARQLQEMCNSMPPTRPLLRSWLFGVQLDPGTSNRNESDGSSVYWMSFGDFGTEGTRWNLWVVLEQGATKASKVEHITTEME